MLIQLYPSESLIKKSEMVTVFNEELKNTVIEMAALMRRTKGAGLAAPQVGINKRFFIMELGNHTDTLLSNIEVIINPVFDYVSATKIIDFEGCLSFPTIFEKIARPDSIQVEYQNLSGDIVKEVYDGKLARCFQHEYEHLQGEVFIKHLSLLKRDMVKRKMLKINTLLGNR